MSLCGSHEEKERLKKRLLRIEGQVRGLIGMIESDRDCIEVLHQVVSVNGALRGVWLQMVGDHLKGCVQDAAKAKDMHIVEELIEHLGKMR